MIRGLKNAVASRKAEVMHSHYLCFTTKLAVISQRQPAENIMFAQMALEAESTLTDRFQTTIPSPVRQALHLDKKDKIKYIIQSDGSVLMQRAETAETDPVLELFLSFLAVLPLYSSNTSLASCAEPRATAKKQFRVLIMSCTKPHLAQYPDL